MYACRTIEVHFYRSMAHLYIFSMSISTFSIRGYIVATLTVPISQRSDPRSKHCWKVATGGPVQWHDGTITSYTLPRCLNNKRLAYFGLMKKHCQEAFLFAKVSKDIHTYMCAASSLFLSLSLCTGYMFSYDIFVTFELSKVCISDFEYYSCHSLSLSPIDPNLGFWSTHLPWLDADLYARRAKAELERVFKAWRWRIWSWMHAICRKVFPSSFLERYFTLPQPCSAFGPHEKTWCSLENQSCQMHRRTGSGTPRAVGCSVSWIPFSSVLSVSVIRKVLRASWQWIFNVKMLAISKFKKSRGLLCFYVFPFHAKEPFRTASRRHRRTSIAGGSKEETLNANRIPGTAGSARISVRLWEGFDRELQWLVYVHPS